MVITKIHSYKAKECLSIGKFNKPDSSDLRLDSGSTSHFCSKVIKFSSFTKIDYVLLKLASVEHVAEI